MDILDIFNKRRSVNWFDSGKPLGEEMLRNTIDTASMAPSAFNLEPWRIIAVRSEERKLALQKLAMNQPKVSQAPVTLIVIGDRNGYDSSNPAWKGL
jgi:nitroreductase